MIDTVIEVICSHAKWQKPLQKEQNFFSFLLENNAELSLFSPNGQDCIFIVTLSPVPEDSQRDNFLQNLARKNAGMYKKRKSVLSVTNGKITLHRLLRRQELSSENILQTAKDILNDADIWHTILSENKQQASPFSFAGMKF